jgi:hypothetical protein
LKSLKRRTRRGREEHREAFRSPGQGIVDAMTSDGDSGTTAPCPHCGREIYDDAERCPKCGTYLSAEDAPQRWPVWLVVGALLALVAAAVLALG